MNEMILASWHRIRNSNPGGPRPNTLPLGHGGSPQYYFFTSERGRNILFLWNLNSLEGFNPRSPTFQAVLLTMHVWCWPIVYDAGPTSKQHCLNVPCLFGYILHDLYSKLWLYEHQTINLDLHVVITVGMSRSPARSLLYIAIITHNTSNDQAFI